MSESQTDLCDFNTLSSVEQPGLGVTLMLPVCSACGAVVPPAQQPNHREWHQRAGAALHRWLTAQAAWARQAGDEDRASTIEWLVDELGEAS